MNTAEAFEVLLAMKRIGAKKIEEMWGVGQADTNASRGRRPAVRAPFAEELDALAKTHLDRVSDGLRARFLSMRPRVMVASTDVHEHGKIALESVLKQLGAEIVDGGVSTDPETLAAAAVAENADAILLSTYNGIALDYFTALKSQLPNGIPVLIGGRLNQVPKGSNTSLPVDVSSELAASGAIVCREIEDAVPALLAAARR